MAAEKTLNRNSFIQIFNIANNYKIQLNLKPPIEQAEFVRMIPDRDCIIKSSIIKPIYSLNSNQSSLEVPQQEVVANRFFCYKTVVNKVDFQTIEIVNPIQGLQYSILFEFFQFVPARNLL